MDTNHTTHADTDITYADADGTSGKSEVPVITMIVASIALWAGLIFLVPVVVLGAVVLMIALAIIQVAIAPYLRIFDLRDTRCATSSDQRF